MIKISRILFLILDVIFRAVGIVLGLINLLGYVWFASTLPFVLVIPPLVMFAVILVPLRIFASERWLLVVLATIYVASFVFGGFNFALTNDRFVTLVLQEAIVVVYFFVRAMYLSQKL
ncbi:MAG: hypothetical protein PHH47_08805 [Gallionella sp.]|nr:hypothetical protein [Gallionella sp.]MDD4947499.1 hypothetical protein [Gallionella sp.]